MGMKSTGGEIVEVQGGHIVRSTGRKDRHSKVYTAKGPRDRRVRLSAHTAIQFYDVQDRLGYDRPSKAVDWLIKKAKTAIDKLAELPPWHPIPSNVTEQGQENGEGGSSDQMPITAEHSESSGYNFQLQNDNTNNHHHSAFMPSNIDTDAIAFFPTTSSASTINFQSYHPDIMSRTNNSTQDLGLSLHSYQGGNQNQNQNQTHSHSHDQNQNLNQNQNQNIFSGTSPIGFEANYHRIVNWNNDAAAGVAAATDMNRTGFMVNNNGNNSSAFLGQGSAYSHRGTLQSSFSPRHPWNDIPMASNEHHHHNKSQPTTIQQAASIFGSRFLSDALPGFCIPARIQGEDESHGVGSERPSSSSNSHH